MRLFLDTEFTDFINTELISIGIVDENGREFYAESTSFHRELCSAFVVKTVLPLLGQYSESIVGNKSMIAHRLAEWLEHYRESGAVVCVDYDTDWQLFVGLLSRVDSFTGQFITVDMIWNNLNLPKIESWWSETGFPRHMALYDARANRHGYDEHTQFQN